MGDVMNHGRDTYRLLVPNVVARKGRIRDVQHFNSFSQKTGGNINFYLV